MFPDDTYPPPIWQTSCLRPRQRTTPNAQANLLPIPQKTAMSPINAKAVVAATAFELPVCGQTLMSIHRTTTPTPLQETRRHTRQLFPSGLSP